MDLNRREWLSVPAFLRRHSGVIGRTTLYGLIHDGRIEVIRISPRKYLIPGLMAKNVCFRRGNCSLTQT